MVVPPRAGSVDENPYWHAVPSAAPPQDRSPTCCSLSAAGPFTDGSGHGWRWTHARGDQGYHLRHLLSPNHTEELWWSRPGQASRRSYLIILFALGFAVLGWFWLELTQRCRYMPSADLCAGRLLSASFFFFRYFFSFSLHRDRGYAFTIVIGLITAFFVCFFSFVFREPIMPQTFE